MTAKSASAVLFVPDWRGLNPYMERLRSGLEQQGYEVYFDHYPDGYFKLNRLANAHPRVGLIHLHWLSSGLTDHFFWSGSKLKFAMRLSVLMADLLLCRLRGIRIIWTLHNLIEHESPNPDGEMRIRKLLGWVANAVIAHSKQALDLAAATYRTNLSRKGYVIPHGNYIGSYHDDEKETELLRRKYGLAADNLVLLFFGSLRKYKGIEFLITAIRNISDPRLRIIVAGKPFDDGLRRLLIEKAAQDERIKLFLDAVPERQVAAHFALADAVILPLRRSLTSGSVVLAMSFGKCLVLPESARVLGIPGDSGALYYESQAMLENILRRMREFETKKMGANNLIAARQLDWETIAASTAKVYGKRATSH